MLDPGKNPESLRALVAATVATSGWREAASLIEKNWDAFATAAPNQLLAAVKELPGEAFVERAALVVAANYLQNVATEGDPRRFFHDGRLTSLPHAESGSDLDALILLTAQSAGARTAGRLAEARAAAQRARAALRSLPESARAPMARSLPHLRFQWARAFDAADAPGTLAEYEEAYDLARFTAQPVISRRAAAHIAWLHADKGRLRLADRWLARAQGEHATNGRYDVIVFLTAALLKYDRGDSTAEHDLGRALALPVGEQWAAALWVASLLDHAKPGAASLLTHLETELERHPEAEGLAGANGRYIKAARSRLTRLRPNLRASAALPQEPASLDSLLAAADAHRAGNHLNAIAVSEEAIAKTNSLRVQAPSHLIVAASHLALAHPQTAAGSFSRGNSIIGLERMYSAYSFVPVKTVTALAELAGEQVHDRAHPATESIDLPKLTNREKEILGLLATGLPMSTIAADLYISPNTLKATVRGLYRKLGVNSRAEAVDAAGSRH